MEKKVCKFIGGILGFLLGLSALKEDMPLLGIILMISGVPLGGYVSNYIDIDIKLLC